MSIIKTFLVLLFSLPLLIMPQSQVQAIPQNVTATPIKVSPTPTTDTSEWIVPVKRSTPDADEKIYHIVKQGQSPWMIARAYDTRINVILGLNGLPTDTTLYIGQRLLMPTSTTPEPTEAAETTDTAVVETTPTLLPTPDIKQITPEVNITPTPDLEAQAQMAERLRGVLFVSLVIGVILIIGGILINRR